MNKLTKALGGLAVIVGLAGGLNSNSAEAQDTLRHSQHRNYQEFYENGREELPEGTYYGDGIFRAGLWSVHPIKITIRETCYISKEVWEKIECNERTFYERRTIVEPHLREREELLGYHLHCNKEGDIWHKGGENDNLCLHEGYARAKKFRDKLCEEAKKHGRVLKEDLKDLGHDVKRGGCKVLEGAGDVLSVPFYIGGAVLGGVGECLDNLGGHSHKHYHPHPIPGNLDPYRAPVPWTTHPEFKPSNSPAEELYFYKNSDGSWSQIKGSPKPEDKLIKKGHGVGMDANRIVYVYERGDAK